MLTTCSEPGCTTLVMGGRCLEHEKAPTRIFVRGRPFAVAAETDVSGHGLATIGATAPARTLELHGTGSALTLPRG